MCKDTVVCVCGQDTYVTRWTAQIAGVVVTRRHYDIFVNCNWIDTRWQQYSTHLHTNNTQNRTTQ